jgi:hypothetical protein
MSTLSIGKCNWNEKKVTNLCVCVLGEFLHFFNLKNDFDSYKGFCEKLA